MGVKISKRYTSHGSVSFFTKLFFQICPVTVLTKLLLSILKLQIMLQVLLPCDPMGHENFKMLLLLDS